MILDDKYLIVKQKDVDRFLTVNEKAQLAGLIRTINEERMKLGKETGTKYYVVNLSSPVAPDVEKILDGHGYYKRGTTNPEIIFPH